MMETRGTPLERGLVRLLDRPAMQTRVYEELLRSRRYSHEFGLILCEEIPSSTGVALRQRLADAARAIQHTVRATDGVAQVFEDALAVLLVETPSAGVEDALFRIRQQVSVYAGAWRFTAYRYPDDEAAIRSLPFMRAV
jgi:hypothetical protein